jgi:hypothetical protein
MKEVRLIEPRELRADREDAPPPRPRRHLLRDTFRTLEILLLIVYVTLLAVSRTAGFRSLLSRQVESRLGGGAVTIGASKLTPDFRLILEDLRLRWPNAQGTEIGQIQSAEMRPDWPGWLDGFRLKQGSLSGARFIFQVTEAGAVSPPFGQDLTRWLHYLGWITPEIDLAAAGGDPELWWMLDAPVRFQDVDIHWVSARGGRHVAAEGVQGEVRPLQMERAAFRYVDLSVRRMTVENGASLTPPPLRVLLAPDRVERLHDLQPAPRPAESRAAVSPKDSIPEPRAKQQEKP